MDIETRTNTQTAPYPDELLAMVKVCRYRAHEGWSVRLADDLARDEDSEGNVIGRGLTLVITTCGLNTYHPEHGRNYCVNHYFIVPPATYDMRSWRRWLFEQYVKVETHEAMENFVLGDERPYRPSHGPGSDPYLVRELGTELDQKTSFRGVVND